MRSSFLFVLGIAITCATAVAATARPAARIAIDVGHSNAAQGATSARGRVEHEFNRQLAREIALVLTEADANANADLIGEHGDMDRLMDRVHAAAQADLLVSVHHDSVQEHFLQTWQWEGVERRFSDRYAGFSLFVSRKNAQLSKSLVCASSIGAALRHAGFKPSLYHAEPIRGESKPFADRTNGVHYFDNLVVLRHARGPALLFEAGVIVNRNEELDLESAPRRRRMAEAVAAGIAGCVGTRK